jgi:hypothetical protein
MQLTLNYLRGHGGAGKQAGRAASSLVTSCCSLASWEQGRQPSPAASARPLARKAQSSRPPSCSLASTESPAASKLVHVDAYRLCECG